MGRTTPMYVLRFCNRYSSEIYHILNDLIPRLSSGDLIYSIGCGSCMETIGIEKYCRDNNIRGVSYEGIDSNSQWQNITNTCCVSSNYLSSRRSQFSNRQQFLPMLPNIKILLLNYMLSDYKNHNNKFRNMPDRTWLPPPALQSEAFLPEARLLSAQRLFFGFFSYPVSHCFA